MTKPICQYSWQHHVNQVKVFCIRNSCSFTLRKILPVCWFQRQRQRNRRIDKRKKIHTTFLFVHAKQSHYESKSERELRDKPNILWINMYDSSQKTKGKRLNHVPPTRDYQYLLSDNHHVTLNKHFLSIWAHQNFARKFPKEDKSISTMFSL